MTLKLISIFLLSILTGGCQSVSISDVKKKIKPAGQPGQPILMRYSATVEVSETIIVTNVKVVGISEKLTLAIYRLPDGIVISPENKLEPGKYSINATTLYSNELAATEDELIFYIKDISDKEMIIKKKALF